MAIREHQIMGDVGQIVPMRFHPDYFETLKDICSRSNIVVNAAGRDFDKYGDTMEIANVKFAESIAKVIQNIIFFFFLTIIFRQLLKQELKDYFMFQ